MKKRVFIIEGLAFLLIGLVFLLNSFSSITGAVVLENANVNVSGLLGLVFVIVGIAVMMAGERGKISIDDVVDGQGHKPVITDDFRKAIRRHDPKKIITAIRKIGTGLGKQEPLTHIKHQSVRSGEGGYRVIFDYNQDGEPVLLNYSDHYREYERH